MEPDSLPVVGASVASDGLPGEGSSTHRRLERLRAALAKSQRRQREERRRREVAERAVLVSATDRGRDAADRVRLAEIVGSSDDAIVSLDADLRIVGWNRGAEAIYGYSAAEILGQSSDVLIPADATSQSRGLRERAVSEGEVPS
jgi:PAS domain-containing protein